MLLGGDGGCLEKEVTRPDECIKGSVSAGVGEGCHTTHTLASIDTGRIRTWTISTSGLALLQQPAPPFFKSSKTKRLPQHRDHHCTSSTPFTPNPQRPLDTTQHPTPPRHHTTPNTTMSSPSSSTSSLSPPPSPPSYTALDAASAARSGASFLAWPSDEPYYPTSSPSTSPPSQSCSYTLAQAVPTSRSTSSRNYHRAAAAATYDYPYGSGGGQDGYYAPREAASDAASGACFVAAWPGDHHHLHHHYHQQQGLSAGHHHVGQGSISSGQGNGHSHGRHGHGHGGKVHHSRQQAHKGGAGAGKKGVVAVSGSRNK